MELQLNSAQIAFDIHPSDAACPLSVEIWMDDVMVLSCNDVQHKVSFVHDMSDDDGEHELRVVLTGKMPEHTQIDATGTIIKDSTLTVGNVVIDGLDVNHLFLTKCVYTHDFNGTQPKIQDTFHGLAGCNGTISWKFSTPIYLWLLEHM